MKEIQLEELLKLQVEILKKVDLFCRESGIDYYLCGGTAIGAIRHKGYIPWDDDIDIAMTRPNYDRFLQSFNGYYEHLRVYAPELNWNFYAPYANVCDLRTILYEGANGHNGMDIGVKIDIFPLDGAPTNETDFMKVFRRNMKLKNDMRVKRANLSYLWDKDKKRFLKFLVKRVLLVFRSYASMQIETHKNATAVEFGSTDYVTGLAYPEKPIRGRLEWYQGYIDVNFEDMIAMINKNYDIIMRSKVGDYMQLPPVEERVMHHGFKAYWKE